MIKNAGKTKLKHTLVLLLSALLAICLFCTSVPAGAAARPTNEPIVPGDDIAASTNVLFGRCPLFDRVVGEQMLSGEITPEEAFAELDSRNCPIIRGASITSPQQLQDAVDRTIKQESAAPAGHSADNSSHLAHPDTSECQRLKELTDIMWGGSGSPREMMDELVTNTCPSLTSCAQFSRIKEKYASGKLQPSKAIQQLMQNCPIFSPTVARPAPAVQRNADLGAPPGKSMSDECRRLSDMMYAVNESQDTAETKNAAEQAMKELCDTRVPIINNCPLYQGVKTRYQSGQITAQMAIGEMKGNCPILSRELNPAMIFNFEEYGMHRDPYYDMGHGSHSHSDPTLCNAKPGGCGCCSGHGKKDDSTPARGSAKQLYKRHVEASDPDMCLPDGSCSRSHDQNFAKRPESRTSGLERLLGGIFPKGNPALSSLLGTLYISLFPNLILFATPSSIPNKMLRIMVAFAVGGLLGDVFLHLMPHMFADEHNHGEHSSHEHIHSSGIDPHVRSTVYGCTVFLGLMVFFMVDKLMRVLGNEHSHNHGHSHGHSYKSGKASSSSADSSDSETKHKLRKRHGKKNKRITSDANEADDEKDEQLDAFAGTSAKKDSSKKQIKLSAYLNLVADATHNFTDGLAMSASFYLSHAAGLSTFVAVFFHEIPHELGDFAILVQSGFSRTSALASQFFTALGAIAGTIAGILIEETGKGNRLNLKGIFISEVPIFVPTATASTNNSMLPYILSSIFGLFPSSVGGVPWGKLVIPFTAGGFIYVGTVSVLPDLLQPNEETKTVAATGKGRVTAKRMERQKVRRGVYMAFVELGAMLVGLGIMAAIALGEE